MNTKTNENNILNTIYSMIESENLSEEKINDITTEIVEKKFSKDIWLLFIMSPYIFLDRDDGHFVSLNNTIKMVAEATEIK